MPPLSCYAEKAGITGETGKEKNHVGRVASRIGRKKMGETRKKKKKKRRARPAPPSAREGEKRIRKTDTKKRERKRVASYTSLYLL